MTDRPEDELEDEEVALDEEAADEEADDEAEGSEPADADELEEEELEDEGLEPLGAEPTSAEAAAAGGLAPGAPTARRRTPVTGSVQRAPTQSELAVRVTDSASRFFVIATVAIFAAILAWGVLAGSGGLLTKTPPPTAAPSVSAGASETLAPSGSASPGASPS